MTVSPGTPAWWLPQAMALRFVVVLTMGLNTLGMAQSAPPVTLQDLTVPKDRLPEGCALKLIEPAHQEVIATTDTGRRTVRVTGATPSLQPAGVTANPWTGADRRVLAGLRQRVDGYGTPRLPDAPPLTSGEEAAMFLQFANGVEEGYAATYAQSGGRDLGVQAVRFTVATERHLDVSRTARVENTRTIDIGLIRASVYGDGGPCASAIEGYVRSLVN